MAIARLLWAGILLAFPGVVFRVLGAGSFDRTWRVIARVLGVRHLGEALLASNGRRDRLELTAAIDALHAVSALGLAAVSRRRRRLALADAAIAGMFAGWGIACACATTNDDTRARARRSYRDDAR